MNFDQIAERLSSMDKPINSGTLNRKYLEKYPDERRITRNPPQPQEKDHKATTGQTRLDDIKITGSEDLMRAAIACMVDISSSLRRIEALLEPQVINVPAGGNGTGAAHS